MIKNYVTIAFRLLIKNKVFSLINILGLSTGIACCILITLYIQDEFNYEKGFEEADKIFRINTTFIKNGTEENGPFTSPPIAFDLADALPEIETATRVVKPLSVEQNLVRYEDKIFFEKEAVLVDSTFLDVFSYRLLEGDPATALDNPSTVLISEEARDRIFADKAALDELLIINSGQSADTFRVTGVIQKTKYPSHIDADFYMSMQSNGWGEWVLSQTTWANNNVVGSYLKLRDPSIAKSLEAKFPKFIEEHAGEELRASGRGKILFLQKLADIRLYSDVRKGSENQSSITYIYIIGTIGIFILLLACINFINLTTAKSSQRAGEVGIRKSMGAYKGNLIRQFLGESMVIVICSLLVSFMIVLLVLPSFNSIMQKDLSLNTNNLLFLINAAVVICLTTGILAGGYPAFFLSSLKPTEVLKGKTLSGHGSQWLRKSLVVFQFVITITLISSIVIIQQQMSYIQSKSLGFAADQVIMIPMRTQQASRQYTALKQAFVNISGIKTISASSSVPSTPLARDWGIYKEGSSNDHSLRHEIVSVDEEYFKTLDIDIIAGRDFNVTTDNLAGDTVNNMRIILNEASLQALDISLDDAVGSVLYFEPGEERYAFSVIGVVKNFHQFSLHQEIKPMIFFLPDDRNYFPYLTASIDMSQFNQIQEQMKSLWDERINDAPFETVFLNENIRKMYMAEKRTSTMLTISTTIALLISCLGLYGLSVYVAERRIKEIGIRKVVGASVQSIVTMLSKEYVKLILIAFCISLPLGYFAMDKWLEGFAYKISPGVTVFLVSGLISFVIAWFTVSFESFRAARKNPADTFRSN